jgi:hypothetical protein
VAALSRAVLPDIVTLTRTHAQRRGEWGFTHFSDVCPLSQSLKSYKKECGREGLPTYKSHRINGFVELHCTEKTSLSKRCGAPHSFWNQPSPHTHKCAILISALIRDDAGGEYPSRFISCILQQKSNYSMWRDFTGSKISHSRTVISMCP